MRDHKQSQPLFHICPHLCPTNPCDSADAASSPSGFDRTARSGYGFQLIAGRMTLRLRQVARAGGGGSTLGPHPLTASGARIPLSPRMFRGRPLATIPSWYTKGTLVRRLQVHHPCPCSWASCPASTPNSSTPSQLILPVATVGIVRTHITVTTAVSSGTGVARQPTCPTTLKH